MDRLTRPEILKLASDKYEQLVPDQGRNAAFRKWFQNGAWSGYCWGIGIDPEDPENRGSLIISSRHEMA